ncbi:cupin domain-containing protein [Hoeflea sp.]|uniref:cupin domain-containing protein n=1 Tax=Hoeflea sp. TaxID=1940281 RepID=UPI003F4AB2B1
MNQQFPEIQADPGVKRQVLSDSPELMVVAFRFQNEGAEGKHHHHPHIQSTYAESGRFAFTIAGKTLEVARGDSFVIPSNAVHGCKCLEPGTLIDTFAPRRDDFLMPKLDPEHRVFHFMGQPDETRHIVMANEKVVISPPWSIHCGAGTGAYTWLDALRRRGRRERSVDRGQGSPCTTLARAV